MGVVAGRFKRFLAGTLAIGGGGCQDGRDYV
jgi:hypothetical protein